MASVPSGKSFFRLTGSTLSTGKFLLCTSSPQ
jgi:hypothetical protein